ncbi:MAG: hypothetical protein WC322_03335 [Candidatus Paceibacterota bacterium]|jgi:hypothetical protein
MHNFRKRRGIWMSVASVILGMIGAIITAWSGEYEHAVPWLLIASWSGHTAHAEREYNRLHDLTGRILLNACGEDESVVVGDMLIQRGKAENR